jgi:hypothetical protein
VNAHDDEDPSIRYAGLEPLPKRRVPCPIMTTHAPRRTNASGFGRGASPIAYKPGLGKLPQVPREMPSVFIVPFSLIVPGRGLVKVPSSTLAWHPGSFATNFRESCGLRILLEQKEDGKPASQRSRSVF